MADFGPLETNMPTTLLIREALVGTNRCDPPCTGYAVQVQDAPHVGPCIMVSVVTPTAVHAVFLDGEQADSFAQALASARLRLAAGGTGSVQ